MTLELYATGLRELFSFLLSSTILVRRCAYIGGRVSSRCHIGSRGRGSESPGLALGRSSCPTL